MEVMAVESCGKTFVGGERALALAQEVLQQLGAFYAFKTSHRGYAYVRLDKLPNEYGCLSIDEINLFSRQYKKRLDEVSSPGANRLLGVPDDLSRFQDMPMVVSYIETSNARCPEKNRVYLFDSTETESRCIRKLSDVNENRDRSAKESSLSHKQKDWRLKLPYGD